MNIATAIDSTRQLTTFMRKELTFAHVEPPVTHFFSDGVYVREIFMPADLLIVGKVHKTRHLNIVSKGRCLVVTPVKQLVIDATTFPQTFESLAGEQKVVYMLEDTVWSTVHVTAETDLSVLEEQLVSPEYDEAIMNKLIEQAREVLV